MSDIGCCTKGDKSVVKIEAFLLLNGRRKKNDCLWWSVGLYLFIPLERVYLKKAFSFLFSLSLLTVPSACLCNRQSPWRAL